MASSPNSRDALLIVDPQIDFCPGGALAVPGGDEIFEAVNRAAERLPIVVASRDWHPEDHVSYEHRGGPWPVHCQAGTAGAEFHPALAAERVHEVFSKGTEPHEEAYSAFQGTGLAEWLRSRGVERLFVAGLATDYCVLASVLDARKEGFEVVVLEDAIGAVDVQHGDGEKALDEMRRAGAELSRSDRLG